MSRTYEALKKAERQRTNGSPPPVMGGRMVPDIRWGEDDPTRLAYERIQVWLANAAPQSGRLQAIMVAAPRGGTGTTTTATRVAAALAERRTARVLVVDANLRTPCLDMVFAARNAAGLSELLAGDGDDERSQPTVIPNLAVLTTGHISRVPSEVFERAAVERVVTRLKSRFDFIVFDAAPLLEFPDSYALAPHVDGVLLVVEADRTPVDDARRVTRDLERSGARMIGVVLNRHRDYIPRFLRRLLHPAN